MDARTRFNALYKVASIVQEQSQIYSSTPIFVDGHMADAATVKAFASLNKKLSKQLDKLRKQCK